MTILSKYILDLNYFADAIERPDSVYKNTPEGTGPTDLPSPLFTELSMSEETGIEEETSADVEQTITYAHPQRGKYVSAFFSLGLTMQHVSSNNHLMY